jgi:hypothetical protein
MRGRDGLQTDQVWWCALRCMPFPRIRAIGRDNPASLTLLLVTFLLGGRFILGKSTSGNATHVSWSQFFLDNEYFLGEALMEMQSVLLFLLARCFLEMLVLFWGSMFLGRKKTLKTLFLGSEAYLGETQQQKKKNGREAHKVSERGIGRARHWERGQCVFLGDTFFLGETKVSGRKGLLGRCKRSFWRRYRTILGLNTCNAVSSGCFS